MEKLIQRINELESMKEDMDSVVSVNKIELKQNEIEAVKIREEIAQNTFENTGEYKELQELKTTKKWLDIYKDKE